MHISKHLLSIFADFLFSILIFTLLIAFVFVAKLILYPTDTGAMTLTLRTESMPRRFESVISEGDTVFDTLTKRAVGKIKHIERLYESDRVSFIIEIDARFKPKSESLRTPKLWFFYTDTEEAVKI